jgi:DNA-binding winged helix-turn-helix (wHTH) protein
MAQQTESPALVRFGAFEVDLRTGELHKQGKRIKLQEQPFQVLSVLLQHPGDVVTRDDLRLQIWLEDTFVDFDNSLNTAINKLREALGDSADSPRFIETLPRRGYRFIAPLSSDHQEKLSITAARQKMRLVVAAALALVATTAGLLLWRSRQAPRLTEKDTIVLGDFANSTGDPVFDGTLREGLSVQLEQSPFLSLLSEKGIHRTLRMMERPANTRLTPEITSEVCQRTSSAAALDGSIALIGSRYNLILKAVSCVNGELMASTEAQANDKSRVLDALGKVASEMRRRLGESLSTVQKYNTPLEQATTSSLEALQAYSLGVKTMSEGDFVGALPLFQRAIQFDPNFAMAYWAMSVATSESTFTAENTRKAFELRTRVSEREKLIIEGYYHEYVTGELVKARRSYVLGAQIYPRDDGFYTGLAMVSNAFGQYEPSLKENLEALHVLRYNDADAYRSVVYSYLLLDRVEDARATARGAHAKGLDSALASVLYGIAFYQNDSAEMARQAASAAGREDEELLLALEADTAAYFGHLGKAREFSRQAADSAQHAGEKETAASYEAASALREALFGLPDKARQQAALAMKHSSGRDMDYAVALALAYAGDRNRAEAIAVDLNERFPEDTVMQLNYLPTLRAKLAFGHTSPREVLDVLRAAAPYELGLTSLNHYNWPNLYPVYVRGEAYLASHQGPEAAAEFQKILDHRGIVLNEPIGALAHLQLGCAYALQGETAKARAAYQDFLTLWKDADPDIPILKQAKSEYTKLQ